MDDDASRRGGFILPGKVHHARILPRKSQNAFQYPVVYYAFNLKDFEMGNLDAFPAFGKWSMTNLDARSFGRKTTPIGISTMRLKLLYELRLRGYLDVGPQDVSPAELASGIAPWESQIDDIWAIAMPTLFGLAGFNPLTVFYAYKGGELQLAILEVHNTFNERHIYVCRVDARESKRRKGYDYSWTFPRDFHVSPFNDRLGYYQLFLRDLWQPGTSIPTIDVRLLLLTPEKEKKLLATLSSRGGARMSRGRIFTAIAKQPLDLVLPVSRIMFQAAKLHWIHQLPVYVRPEQGNQKHNAVQDDSRGGIYWNDESFVEKQCRKVVEQYLQGTSTRIEFDNPELSTKSFSDDSSPLLVIQASSSAIFTDLCTFSPDVAYLIGCLTEGNWQVNSKDAFKKVFHEKNLRRSAMPFSAFIAQGIRLAWQSQSSSLAKSSLLNRRHHPFDQRGYSLAFLFAFLLHTLIFHLTIILSQIFQIRYIRSPWLFVKEYKRES